MLYLVLTLLPVTLAAGTTIARGHLRQGELIVLLLAMTMLVIVLVTPVAPPVVWLGTTLVLVPSGGMLLGSWQLVMIGVVLASFLHTPAPYAAPVMLLLSAAVSAALLVESAAVAGLLLVLVALFLSLLLVDAARQPPSHPAAPDVRLSAAIVVTQRNMVGAVLCAGCIVAAFRLEGAEGSLAVARACLVVLGLGLWTVLLPATVIFSGHVERLGLPTLVLLAGALPSITGLGLASAIAPDARAGLGLAMLALLPACALLAPVTPRQLLALLLVVDGSLRLAGSVAGSGAGTSGALIGSVAHAIAAGVLLLGAMVHMWLARRHSRHEVTSTLAIVAGLLLLIGAPPFLGWHARLLLWDAARSTGLAAALLFAAAQLLMLAGAGRLVVGLLREMNQIRENDAADHPARHPRIGTMRAALLVVLSLALLSGFAVRPLLGRIGATPADGGSTIDVRSTL